MDAEFAKHYRELYERHWWFRAREDAILETLRRLRSPGGRETILDVGCGDGLFFERLTEFGSVEGVEPDAANISDRHRNEIHVQPFDETFQPGKQYDLILMLDVVEHLPEPAKALRHALALLAPGGALVVTVPAFNLLWTNHDVLNHHFRRYTKSGFRELARQAGLRIEKQQYLFQWVCPVKLAERLAEGIFRLQPTVPTTPPAWMNRSLYFLTRLEQKTLGVLPFPFGSSLLVVGRK